MSIRSDIIAKLKEVAAEQDKPLAPLKDDLPLIESGLDSLCLAVVVARLEDTLGVDPFSSAASQGSSFPATVGEFIKFYENATE